MARGGVALSPTSRAANSTQHRVIAFAMRAHITHAALRVLVANALRAQTDALLPRAARISRRRGAQHQTHQRHQAIACGIWRARRQTTQTAFWQKEKITTRLSISVCSTLCSAVARTDSGDITYHGRLCAAHSARARRRCAWRLRQRIKRVAVSCCGRVRGHRHSRTSIGALRCGCLLARVCCLLGLRQWRGMAAATQGGHFRMQNNKHKHNVA